MTGDDRYADRWKPPVEPSAAEVPPALEPPGQGPPVQGSPGSGLASDPPGFPYAPWGSFLAIFTTVAALIAGFLLGLPFVLFDGVPGEDLGLFTTISFQICAGIAFIAVPMLLALRYGGTFRIAMRRLGFVSFRVGTAAKWIGIGIVSYLAFSIVWSVVIGTPEQDDIAGNFGPIGWQILLIVVLAPVAEEICFRGMLFSGLRNRLPMWAAALGAGAIFGALHYSTGVSAVPVLIVLGVIFAVVYEKTGSIWPPIIMHVGNNAFALAVLSST